jgi:rare lipoprotein A
LTIIGTFVEYAGELINLDMRYWVVLLLSIGLSYSAWAQSPDPVRIQTGWASFYGKKFHLRKTANGEIFHMDSLTAAHKYLPFGTWVKVTRVDTRDSVWVRINDRLPKTSRRIIDLSRSAATKLNMRDDGIAEVTVQVSSIEEMNRLFHHFDGDAPGTLRLRWYEEAIHVPERTIDWIWNLVGKWLK